MADLDLAADFAAFMADDFGAAVEDDQTDRFGVIVGIVGVYGVVVVAAPSGECCSPMK